MPRKFFVAYFYGTNERSIRLPILFFIRWDAAHLAQDSHGAALDVWYNYPGKNPEPIFPAHLPIYDLPNVLLSPHKSSHTIEGVNAMIDDTYENVRSYILNGKPNNAVELD